MVIQSTMYPLDVRGIEIYSKGYKTYIEDNHKRKNLQRWWLYTIMTEESIVKSQPLTKASNNIDDYKTLTPNHFLLVQRSNNIPLINNKEVDVTLRRK